jgi:hypothetical protein
MIAMVSHTIRELLSGQKNKNRTLDASHRIAACNTNEAHNPNEEGTDQKRSISLNGDELRIRNPSTGFGGSSETVFRRAK